MPKHPLEHFFDQLFDSFEEAAEELVRDVNKQARENMRRIYRQLDQAASIPGPNNPVNRPGTTRKRAQKASKPVSRPERPSPPQPTLYDVLECSPRASQETISAAFRSLSTQFHPDTGKVKNENRYKEITAAWTILKNPVKRKEYDHKIGLI